MSVSSQLKHGIIWNAIERFGTQSIQFILSLIIARLLIPEDYGLIAMINIFIALAQILVESGFSDALIQKKEICKKDYNTAFAFNFGISILLACTLYVVAPSIATFYNQPILLHVTRAMTLLPVFSSFCLAPRAKLLRELKFKTVAKCSLISVSISCSVAVLLAYKGFGVWALIAQSLILNGLLAFTLNISTKFIIKLRFYFSEFKELWNFGSKLLATSVIDTLYVNMYGLFIGKKYSSLDAGLFVRSQTMAVFPSTNITTVFIKTFYPIECRINDNNELLKETFLKSIRLSCFVIFPIMIILAASADPVINAILTAKWAPAIIPLQIMCIAYMLTPIMMLNTSLLSVKGKTNFILIAEIIKKIVGFSIILLLLPFGLNIICLGFIIYSIADIFIITYFVNRVTKINLWIQLKSILPVFLISLASGTVAYSVCRIEMNSWLKIIVGGSSGITTYLVCAYLFKFKEIALILNSLKKI